MSEPPERRNLQSFLRTMGEHGARGGFERDRSAVRPYRSIARTFSETLDLAGAAAARLRAEGVRPGDRVVLMLQDGPEWVASFAASLAVGAVAVPLEPSSLDAFVRSVARSADAKAILHDAAGRGRPSDVRAIDVSSLPRGVASDLEPIADPGSSDLAEIVFTSGTTGAPRGVMITHGNLLTALSGIERGILARRRLWRPLSPLTFVNLVPLSHLFGQVLGVLIPSILGARVVFASSRPPRALLHLARRERAWVMILVPRHLAGLRDLAATFVPPSGATLSKRWWVRAWRSRPLIREHGWRLRAFVVGGARLDPGIEGFFKDLGYFVIQGYGLTETAPIISVSNPFDPRVGLLGRPTSAQEVRIAEDGEILVRGGNVTPGYYQDPGATRAALEGGWLHTGDVGVIEPDGSLRFLGRKKDVIVTGEGQNVFPDEVEEALKRHPSIADCAVVAVAGARGEEVHAAIIPAPVASGAGMDAAAGVVTGVAAAVAEIAPAGDAAGRVTRAVAAAVAAANERLAAHQRVRGFTIWSDLDFPRTATGKVLRREVAAAVRARSAERAAQGHSGARGAGPAGAATAPQPEGPLARLRTLAGPEARLDQRLGAELGLSSIDVAELAAEIEERYQVEIDPARIHEDASLQDLIESARSSPPTEEPWPMPRWARSAPARLARSLLQDLVAFPLLRIFVRLEVSGREELERSLRPAPHAVGAGGRIPGPEGRPPGGPDPVLIAASHASHFDVPVLLASMPRSMRRRVAVAMQPEYFEPYLKRRGALLTRLHLGWHYKLTSLLLHTFPFPRSAAFRVALEYAGDMVGDGWSILVFPEGELSRDGAIHAFRPGVGVLARDLGLPVVPARIEGAFDVLPVGGRFPRDIRGRVRVAWGGRLEMADGEAPTAFAARVESAVRVL